MDVFCQDLNEKINTIINIPQKPMDSLTEQDGSNYDFHLISHFNLVAQVKIQKSISLFQYVNLKKEAIIKNLLHIK